MLPATYHIIERQNTRGISEQAIELAVDHGEIHRVREGLGYYVSQHLVRKNRRAVPELEHARNLHVIVSLDERVVITAYFNARCQFKRDYKPRKAVA